MPLLENRFTEIAGILLVAALAGGLGQLLHQPVIVSFLVAGILVGPSGLGIVASYEQVELLAQIGISLLLFVVGLRLDLHLIKTTGPVALATGIGQVVFTSLFGFLIALGFDLPPLAAAYVAVALTFSSTIIIVKLLSDKKEIDSLHGRIAVGFLIVQDVVAILALIGLTALGGRPHGASAPWQHVAWIALKGVLFLGMVALLMRFVLPALVRYVARSVELLVVFAISWAVLLAAGGEALGFSKEVGAFLAGVALASTDYRDAIGARLVTVRDFLLLFFFIDLGARLDVAGLGAMATPAIVFSAFVVIGNPLIVMIIMGFMGYRRRTGFLAGLTVAQISEFSLVLGSLGVALGHLSPEIMGLITLVGLVTIGASTYLILYSGHLYRWLSPHLRLFERRHPYREVEAGDIVDLPRVDAVLLGLGKYGGGIARDLLERGWRIVGVDFDPGVLDRWHHKGMLVLYGDAGDPELLEQLAVERARWVISAVRDRELNLTLLSALRKKGYAGMVALASVDDREAAEFRSAGAHVVLRPFSDAAEQAADALTEALHVLPVLSDWPVSLTEVRLRPGSVFAGTRIRKLPLRAQAGVSILAVSRAGRVHYDPDPDFRLHPGDRVILLGEPEGIRQAREILLQRETGADALTSDGLSIAEIQLSPESSAVGKSLAELRLRQGLGITVIGIRRGERKIYSPGGSEVLDSGDRLIVVGTSEALERVRREHPF
jgi:Kef-type K+ transport system membrane component KefB/Trk K+ transport system NAD-binding subunit